VICENLGHDLPVIQCQIYANRCRYALDSLPTANPTCDDETRCVDCSVHEGSVFDDNNISCQPVPYITVIASKYCASVLAKIMKAVKMMSSDSDSNLC